MKKKNEKNADVVASVLYLGYLLTSNCSMELSLL